MNYFTYFFHKQLSKNKSFEIELNHFGQFLKFEISFDWSFKTDHAGPRFCLALFGLYLTMSIFDHRHWDDENNRWKNYDL